MSPGEFNDLSMALKKALVAQTRNMLGHPLVHAVSSAARSQAPVSREYVDEDGRSALGVAARIAELGWTVIVEQPTREAYANAAALQRQLIVAISIVRSTGIRVGSRWRTCCINVAVFICSTISTE